MNDRPISHKRLYDAFVNKLDDPSGKKDGRQQSWPASDGRVWSFCRAHPDGQKHARRGGRSLSLTADERGIECFAGCSLKDLMSAYGVTPDEIAEPDDESGRRREAARDGGRVTPFRRAPVNDAPSSGPATGREDWGKCIEIYSYRTVNGKVSLEKGRFESGDAKTFRWRKKGDTGWPGIAKYGIKTEDVALFEVDDIIGLPLDTPIIVTEGEKATRACKARQLHATTLCGGSSQRDFGDALEPLRGRIVYLWPDNDAVGREYMRFLFRALRTVAAKILYIRVPVPEHGDAVEYFRGEPDSGRQPGDPKHIFDQSPHEPIREFLADDSIRIVMPGTLTDSGSSTPISLTYTNIEKERRSLRAEVSVQLMGAGTADLPYSAHVDLLSLSNVEAFRRGLDACFGKEANWTRILNTAQALIVDGYRNQDRSIDVANIPDAGPIQWLVDRMFPMGEPGVVFGTGMSTKSYQMFHLATCVALGIDWCGRAVRQAPVLIIDYETDIVNFGRRMRRIAQGLGSERIPPYLMHYWPARGVPLRDCIDAIRRKIEKEGIGLVLIDSAVPACGGEAEKSVVAGQFFNDVRSFGFGVSTIILAHTSAANADDAQYPFGSVFWSNEARVTYWVRRTIEQESDTIYTALVNRKTNEGRLRADFGVRLQFIGDDGAVRIAGIDAVKDVPGSDEARPWPVRIRERLLHFGWMPLEVLAADLEVDTSRRGSLDALKGELNKLVREGKVVTKNEGVLLYGWNYDAETGRARQAPVAAAVGASGGTGPDAEDLPWA